MNKIEVALIETFFGTTEVIMKVVQIHGERSSL